MNPALEPHPPCEELPVVRLRGGWGSCASWRRRRSGRRSRSHFLLEEVLKSCTSCCIAPKPLQSDPTDPRPHDRRLGKKLKDHWTVVGGGLLAHAALGQVGSNL